MPTMKTIVLLPVVLGLALSAQAQAPAEAKRIDIAVSNFKYVPNRIVLHHGDSYVLHFANQASGGHDFVAKAFFDAVRVDPRDAGKVKGGEVALSGGETVDIHLTAPAQPGAIYKVHCSHFMHQSFGMSGEIVVE
jgi:plastocyanin